MPPSGGRRCTRGRVDFRTVKFVTRTQIQSKGLVVRPCCWCSPPAADRRRAVLVFVIARQQVVVAAGRRRAILLLDQTHPAEQERELSARARCQRVAAPGRGDVPSEFGLLPRNRSHGLFGCLVGSVWLSSSRKPLRCLKTRRGARARIGKEAVPTFLAGLQQGRRG